MREREGDRAKMCEQFARSICRTVVAQICQSRGFHRVQLSALDVLVDVLVFYIQETGQLSKGYADNAGRQDLTYLDVMNAFADCQHSTAELETFLARVDELPFARPDPPAFPLSRTSQQNIDVDNPPAKDSSSADSADRHSGLVSQSSVATPGPNSHVRPHADHHLNEASSGGKTREDDRPTERGLISSSLELERLQRVEEFYKKALEDLKSKQAAVEVDPELVLDPIVDVQTFVPLARYRDRQHSSQVESMFK